MKTNQWIISLVVEILIFLAIFYIWQTTFLPALFCGLIGFVCNAFIGWNANRNN
ncbi:hypothetical protein [Staphylococcus chromogenes]|uniref:hypothetical protein n=1 Tax=Staphylococcus chromogenes TaxID=46126 RepID=UPI0015FAF203|nr:hypothetical protein [Staphylococcus chromogenes]MBV5190752.1 hypothetical protein [Staphylococcus chromogenes]MBW3132437.1 hypothetical protein [Staphylococcus chromogenes]